MAEGMHWRERLAALPVEPSQLVAAAVAVLVAVVGGVTWVVTRAAGHELPPTEVLLPRADVPGVGGAVGGAGTSGGSAMAGGAEAGEPPYVHAAGAVLRPGVYRLSPGARVADVLDAAGGPTPEADVDQLNLAARVADGDRVYVPRKGETLPAALTGGAARGPGPSGSSGAGAASGPGAAARLDLNTATLEQLEALPGVGPATARAILDYRRQKGRFRSVEELLEVRGIGESKMATLRPRVRV